MVALIQRINAQLKTNGSTEKLVIAGPSMGGQITRYALAYMEKQYAATNNNPIWLHNTRLWISIDSPNLGANIPEGLQALISLLKDDGKPSAQDFYYNQLGSPAAKQQLINWHDKGQGADYYTVNTSDMNGRTISQGFTTNSGSAFFQQFYNNQFNNGLPNSHGYPLTCRKIAMANGSVTGKTTWVNGSTTGTFGTNDQQTINIRGFNQICFFWCWDIFVAALESYTLPAYGSDLNIARYKHSFTDWHTHAPNNDTRGNVDILPGGWFPGYDNLYNSVLGQPQETNYNFPNFEIEIGKHEVYFDGRTDAQIHCFIPTFSSLGMKNPNQNWGQSLKRNLVCGNEIPFNSYYGHDSNTQHTSFDCRSVSWLLKELDGIPQAPWFPMYSTDLSGSTLLCNNNNAIYSFASLCAIPSGATWTVSSNLQVISSSPTSITIKAISNGAATITATFTNGENVVKNISIGAPPVTASGSPGYCYGSTQTWSLTASPASNGTNWLWAVDYLGQNSTIYIRNASSPNAYADVTGGGTIKLSYTDICGVTQHIGGPTVYSNCHTMFAFTAMPNPAQNNVTISADNSDNKHNSKNLIYAIKLVDRYGQVKKSLEYKSGTTSQKISLIGINAGMYLVSVFDGKTWSSKSLVVGK